jgi:hypothetical protein
VELRLFDMSGRVVWQYTHRDVAVGMLNRVVWDGRGTLGSQTAAGHYLLQLQAAVVCNTYATNELV